MLRIWTVVDPRGLWLQVEGSLRGPWVYELQRAVDEALLQSKLVTLDLKKLWYVDREGIALLRSFSPEKVNPVNCSPFVREQMDSETPS